jgi:aminoglycoside 3-N-acetyltransferase
VFGEGSVDNCMSAVDWLSSRWASVGIKIGDVVLLHSNILRTLMLLKRHGYQPSAITILESFIEAVGINGTLIVPTFNFGFTRGEPFDVLKTKSEMGALTEAAREYDGAVRTGHPIYSFSVIGKQSKLFAGLKNYSAFGKDSPFSLLRELDGKIGVLDLPENDSVTFHHHTEEMMEVSYRYHKEFSGLYTDYAGVRSNEIFSFFVRDLRTQRCLDVLGSRLWSDGIYTGDLPQKRSGLRLGKANDIFNYTSEIIRSGRALGVLYSMESNVNEDI